MAKIMTPEEREAWLEEKRAKRREYQRKRWTANPEYSRAMSQLYYWENREEVLRKAKEKRAMENEFVRTEMLAWAKRHGYETIEEAQEARLRGEI